MHKLSIDDIIDGIEKIITNAQILVEESYILYDANYYTRAYTLGHISREEMAKVFMLYKVGIEIIAGKKYDWKKLRKRFHNHKAKLEFFSMPYSFPVNIEKLNKRKNDSLYVGFENDSFQLPSNVITKKIAYRCIELARMKVFRHTVVDNIIENLEFWKSQDKQLFDTTFNEILEKSKEELLEEVTSGEHAVKMLAVEKLIVDSYNQKKQNDEN